MSQGGPVNKIILLSLSALIACSVSKTKLTSGGEKVEILLNKPKEECSVVEKIVGTSTLMLRNIELHPSLISLL